MSVAAPAVAPADLLDTLPPWPWADLDFSQPSATVATQAIEGVANGAPRTLGWHAIAWAEGWDGFPDMPEGWTGLVQPNGPRARLTFRFTQRQRQFLLWYYAFDEDALWVYDSAARRQPKGSGKSPFAGVHALIEFLGPIRLARFDDRAPGGCRGREVDMPLVQIVATTESQTHNTMRYVRAFAPKGSPVADFYNLDPGKTVYYAPPEKTLQVVTSSSTAAEGAEASFVVKDELEHWVPSKGGPELSATLDDNLAKSGARSLGTCNAWVPGKGSVAEIDYEAWVLQQEGRTRGETKMLYDCILPEPGVDMADASSLKPALERLYGDCDWKKPHEPDPDAPNDLRAVPGSKPDVRFVMRRIWDPKARPDDSERKYLNRPVASEDSWTKKELWQLLFDPERTVAEGEEITLGFDGSKSHDATALIGCCMSDGHVFTLGTWEPLLGQTTGHVNVNDVDRMVQFAFDHYNPVGFFGDVVEWESFVKIEWRQRYQNRLKVWAVGGKDPQPIAWDMRNVTKEFTLATELTLAEIRDGGFTHDGNAVLGRHVTNAVNSPNRWGMSISKETRMSAHKIDACVAMIIARHVRRLVLAEQAKLGPAVDRRVRTA